MKINYQRVTLILSFSVLAGSFIILYLESHKTQERAEELDRSMVKLDEEIKQLNKQVHDYSLQLDNLADASVIPIIDASGVEKEMHLLSEDLEILQADAGIH